MLITLVDAKSDCGVDGRFDYLFAVIQMPIIANVYNPSINV